MKDRKCLQCKEPIPSSKRMDSKFCSNSCKAKHWEQSKSQTQKKVISTLVEPPKKENTLEGLRGILHPLAEKIDVSDVKQTSVLVETSAYKETLSKKQEIETYVNRAKELLNKCNEQIQFLEDWVPFYQPQPKKIYPYRSFSLDMELARENQKCDFSDEFNTNANNEQAQREVKLIELRKTQAELKIRLENAKRLLNQTQEKLKTIPRYEKTENKNVALLSIIEGLKIKKQREELENKNFQPLTILPVSEEKHEAPVSTGGKIISSKELREMDYKCLNFQQRWKELFGQPAVEFHLAVHGKPGEGKSTFCIQFANYLAENFGNVVYISGEEGFSKTLKDKVVNNNVDSKYLFFADCNSFDKIKEDVENKFHFIFIDSLDTLKIDAVRLRELKELYPSSAFVTISQSTKDGKMRGSQEIIHDADITLKVENGTAITTKNRFKERGMEFEVFPKKKSETTKSNPTLRNII